MKITYKHVLMAALTLALTAGLASAKSNANKTVNVTLAFATTMPDGTQLQPGDYRMAVLNDAAAPKVEFYRNGKLMCRCPVKIENAPTKAQTTQLMLDVTESGDHVLNSVAIGGSTQLVVFSTSGTPGA
ncbi:MAG TPA: hypothetical protein VMT20_19215 [Terriglobia bacterium]|nr:hypothetical protein [Terriglobia bacterium]